MVDSQPGYINRHRKASIKLSDRGNTALLVDLIRELIARSEGRISSGAWCDTSDKSCVLLDRSVAFQDFELKIEAGIIGRAILDALSSPYLVSMAFPHTWSWVRWRRQVRF